MASLVRPCYPSPRQSELALRGLDPRIHVFGRRLKVGDGRIKSGQGDPVELM
ncbi:MAG TPA: hypothetical protein VFQ82_13080 [Stellaceae bacterium]|nr:hypothetical protein [Stellaceae bacterium]